MEESGFDDAESNLDGLPASRDWLHHANQSLSRLRDVKKTSYRLGGGPREREVGCQCNYRSKNKSSFLSLEAEPPKLTRDSQDTASMPDLSVPEILKQFNERQSQKTKQKRRPYSSTVYSSKDGARKRDIPEKKAEKKPSYDYNAFIKVTGQTVAPQSRPPSGPVTIADSRADDTGYKGMVHLDRQQLEHNHEVTLAGLRKYSAAFGDDEQLASPVPPPPRASPEPISPRRNSLEFSDSAEGSFSEDDDELINKTSETRSECSEITGGSRPLIFAIPTAGSDDESGDDDASIDNEVGRLSADYVAKSDTFLGELTEKQQTEAAEISDMLQDMENAKEQINRLRISPRDLEVESVEGRSRSHQTTESPAQLRDTSQTPALHVINMSMERASADELESDGGLGYETFWVEEPFGSYLPNSLPPRAGRSCSARYLSQHTARPARVAKHQSESSLVLKGKTVEFFNSEDLAVKNRLSDSRRTSEPCDGMRGFLDRESHVVNTKHQSRGNSAPTKQMGTKPPLPRSDISKKSKKRSDVKKSEDTAVQPDRRLRRSSLKKSSSEGNIPQAAANFNLSQPDFSIGNNSTKKSVTFSQDVLAKDEREVDGSQVITSCIAHENSLTAEEQHSDVTCSSSKETSEIKIACKKLQKSCLWSHAGVIIQNGLEMKEPGLETQDSPDSASSPEPTNERHPQKGNQSTRAKILAKVKESSAEEEPCTCRTVIRPTAALLEETRSGRTGEKEAPSKNEKLLKHRPTRPSSAPIKRSQGNKETVERPKSPRRKPRAMSATVQRKKTGSDGSQSRPRPASAHVGRSSSKDTSRSRAAAKVLKEGFLFKERPPPPLPKGSKDKQKQREEKDKLNNNNSSVQFVWNREEEQVAASDECQQVFARLQEKGVDISMETLKRGLMAPARRADELTMASMGSSSGLLSRPEKWLPEEHARVKVWDDVLKHSK